MTSDGAKCRYCKKELNGKPYYMGGKAYHPITGKECPVNHYGGYVCSKQCDYSASLEQLVDMPGCGSSSKPTDSALSTIRHNWPND